MLGHKYDIGRFDRKMTIIQKVVTNNDFNGESETWEVLKERWSTEKVNFSNRGNESVIADKITATRSMTRVIRYDNTITEEMRVVYEDKVYGIVSVKEPDGTRRRFTEIEMEFLEGEVFNEPEGAFTSGFTSGFNV